VVFRVINSWLRRLTLIDRIRSCASRLAFKVSLVRAWGAIAGTVKLLLPPRQSRGSPWLLENLTFNLGVDGLSV
jgi:hypothetical protein